MIRDIRFEPAKKERLVVLNCLKMFENRGYIDDHTELFKTVEYDDMAHSCTVQLSNEKAIIRIIGEKVSTIGKIPGLQQFLENNQEVTKIIIVEDILARPFKDMLEYAKTEIFWISEFIIDPVNHYLTPKHIPLTTEEKEQFLKEYNIKLKDIPRIEKIDPMVRYYNVQIGDIIKIVRPSIASGEAVSYRIVTNCAWEKLFA